MEPLVRDCAVVGVSKSVPGLLAFRAKQFDHLSNEEFLDALWPAIEDANSRAEAFSQITKNMVALIPSDVDYPHTDKNSIIRAQTYQKFEKEIEALYKNEEESGENAGDEGKLELDLPGLENFLLSTIKKDLDLEVGLDSDLFAAGVDSLKAIQLRRLIIENIALHQQALPQNVIYNCGNVRNLAKHLHSLSKGEELGQAEGQDTEGVRKMIEKYSIEKQDRVVSKPDDDSQFSAIVTGATGAIGVHVLAQLVAREEVKKVYCFCRGQNAPERVKESLRIRKILTRKNFKEEYLEKIVAVEASPSKDNFGLDQETFSALKEDTGLIFHGAWPVNFNIPLGSFEEHIKGLNNLIRFSLQVNRPKPAQVFFCTSISTALGAPEGSIIPDAPVKELSYAAGTGYSQSKLVGEEIMFDAAKKGADAYNVRIGQVVGDTQEGVWNDTDSYPLIIRAATVMKVMPALNEVCEWLPVDTLAEAISQISINVVNHEDPPRMFNLVNPIRCHWDDILKELAKSGLEFQVVPFQNWLEMLRESSAKSEVAINPAIKLIDYFEDLYGDGSVGVGGVQFEVKTAKQFSSAMKSPPDIIEQGLVGKFLSNWLPKWKEEESKVNKA
ncbi:hypothetical protein KEM55_004598 [Ascosphaera atra]|nr:hypothetical protein KEM55_004598 [Ascosphaera atra]